MNTHYPHPQEISSKPKGGQAHASRTILPRDACSYLISSAKVKSSRYLIDEGGWQPRSARRHQLWRRKKQHRRPMLLSSGQNLERTTPTIYCISASTQRGHSIDQTPCCVGRHSNSPRECAASVHQRPADCLIGQRGRNHVGVDRRYYIRTAFVLRTLHNPAHAPANVRRSPGRQSRAMSWAAYQHVHHVFTSEFPARTTSRRKLCQDPQDMLRRLR